MSVCLLTVSSCEDKKPVVQETAPTQEADENVMERDICIYGGSSAGIMAAVAANRLGKSVIIIEPSNHLGGLTTGGLSSTDIGNKHAVTGLARDFYRRMGEHYNMLELWNLVPSVASKVYNQYIEEENLEIITNYRLITAAKDKNTITSIIIDPSDTEESSSSKRKVIKAKVFLDCTYEGDLIAAAGVSYTVGREANSLYNETINGVQLRGKHQFPDGINPYKEAGNKESGLLAEISETEVQPNGTGDKKVQAYNFRLCLTQNKDNMIALEKPATYNPETYALLGRLMQSREKKGEKHDLDRYFIINKMPDGKTDWNHKGGFSLDYIGQNWDYPEADYKTRKNIWQAHEDYTKGLLWFVGHDEQVPAHIREEMLTWGWPKDEFMDNGGFPPQLYVREARRLVGDYVMTEHNCLGDSTVDDGIALAAYTMDSHNCDRHVVNGQVKNEGNVEVGEFPPYEIAYRSLTPKKAECTNLLVPVCMSSSHIAFGSIRMEPVFMVLGEVSAAAAVQAIDKGVAVQDIDVKALQMLLTDRPLLNDHIADVLADDADSTTTFTGKWEKGDAFMSQYKHSFLTAQSKAGKPLRVVFKPHFKKFGKYTAYYYIPHSKKVKAQADSVPIIIKSGKLEDKVMVQTANTEGNWSKIGTYSINPDEVTTVEVIGEEAVGKDKGLTADAILFIADN